MSISQAVHVISITLIQQPGKKKLLILKLLPIASTQQIFLTGTFLHSPNFSLLGNQEPYVNK